MRATRKRLEARAAECGATIEDDGYTFYVYSPEGHVWASTGNSTIVVHCENTGGQSWRPKAYAQALEDMALGLEPADPAHDDHWWTR